MNPRRSASDALCLKLVGTSIVVIGLPGTGGVALLVRTLAGRSEWAVVSMAVVVASS